MRKIRWATLILTITALVSMVPAQTSAQVTFTDVPTDAEYYGHVNYIAEKGIIKGYVENGVSKFKPGNNLTRFQAAKMLVEATGNANFNAGQVHFKDLKSGGEYYNYLSKAVALGYFKTKADGSINAFEQIKREEMGYALAVAFNLSEKVSFERPIKFTDIRPDHPNASKLNGLYYAGVAQGSNGKFMPDSLLNRAQFSQFVARALDEQFKLEVKYPDQTAATFFVKVNTGGATLNIRSLPTTDSAIIGKLQDGEVIEVFGVNDNWNLILVNNIPGYIHSDYTVEVEQVDDEPVEPSIPEEKPEEPIITGDLIGKVTVNTLNVRSGAGTSFPVVESLTLGQKVEVIALNGYWATINVNSITGYVHKSYIKLINTSAGPLKDRIIVLDAGHGGSDPGASKNGVTEKSIALKVTKIVETKLKNAGANVLMTRSTDVFPSLEARVDFAKKNYAETFVSIHANAAGSTAAKGAEVFYDSSLNPNGAESKQLATYIQNNIVKQASMANRGVFDKQFYVIRNNEVASVLVELGFLTNADDFKKLTSDAFLELYAEAIYQGLVQYYSAQ